MNRSMRRAGTMLAALTLTTTGFAVMSGPASAAISDCPSRYACAWVNADYSGRRWQGQFANPTMPSYIANDASSLYNNGVNCNVHWYTGTNYNGGLFTMGRGAWARNLADVGWNDDIESMNWC